MRAKPNNNCKVINMETKGSSGSFLTKGIFINICLLLSSSKANYLEEAPVKLMQVDPVATPFPAAESKYRTDLTNGHDEDAHRTQTEILNNMPDMRMILEPGGCATYNLPLGSDQNFVIVEPARKQGSVYEDYCNKGTVKVQVRLNNAALKKVEKDGSDLLKDVEFKCFNDTTSCSSASCVANFGSIFPSGGSAPENSNLHVVLCNEVGTTGNKASIWEVKLSSTDDAERIQVTFMEEARLRLRHTQDVAEFNTHLSMVSVVGGRGVGKSTIISLLSGNDGMFQVGSGSVGTTTEGADISTVIPSLEWSKVLSEKLNGKVKIPELSLPLFLIDSEGMGIRGDEFDFMTTSPPAIVAKVIVWVGNYNLQTVQVLNDINNYLEGLDGIVLSEGNTVGSREACGSPMYGHFIVVINKMMGSSTDEQLATELLTFEPDYIEGAEDRNKIRQKLTTCFNGVSVHGLPVVTTSGPHLVYQDLTSRFTAGLASMANTILDRSTEPKTVTVGEFSMELNSTNAEIIFGTVIDEASKGSLDLTGFAPFWTLTNQQVIVEIDIANIELEKIGSKCSPGADGGQTCSPCICSFRNTIVETTINKINEIVESTASLAGTVYGEDAKPQIEELLQQVVQPWQGQSICSLETEPVQVTAQAIAEGPVEICDASELKNLLSNPAEVTKINCERLFICNEVSIGYTAAGLSILVSEETFIHSTGSVVQLQAPPASAHGADGATNGAKGEDGQPGLKGTDLTITSSSLHKLSARFLQAFARGGQGGNGGKGMEGAPGVNGANGENGSRGADGAPGAAGADATTVPSDGDPQSAQEVYDFGTDVRVDQTDCHHHCSCQVVTCDYYYWREIKKTSSSVGGNGANGGDGLNGANGTPGADGQRGGDGGAGGNGGNGGNAGKVVVEAPGLVLQLQEIGGAGGQPGLGALGGSGGAGGTGGIGGAAGHGGPGGPGGMGKQQQKTFNGYKKKHEKFDCDFFDCGHDGEDWSYGGYSQNFGPLENCCAGQPGNPGKEGISGQNGANGNPGLAGIPGANGNTGTPGMSTQTTRYYPIW